jgi:hypothetical protein
MKLDDSPTHGGRRVPLMAASSSSSSIATPSLPFHQNSHNNISGSSFHGTSFSKSRSFVMTGLLSLLLLVVLASSFANILLMARGSHGQQMGREPELRRQFEGEIDYKRIEKMIQFVHNARRFKGDNSIRVRSTHVSTNG